MKNAPVNTWSQINANITYSTLYRLSLCIFPILNKYSEAVRSFIVSIDVWICYLITAVSASEVFFNLLFSFRANPSDTTASNNQISGLIGGFPHSHPFITNHLIRQLTDQHHNALIQPFPSLIFPTSSQIRGVNQIPTSSINRATSLAVPLIHGKISFTFDHQMCEKIVLFLRIT